MRVCLLAHVWVDMSECGWDRLSGWMKKKYCILIELANSQLCSILYYSPTTTQFQRLQKFQDPRFDNDGGVMLALLLKTSKEIILAFVLCSVGDTRQFPVLFLQSRKINFYLHDDWCTH